MANKFKPISISLSPNVQKDDVQLALKLLFQPHKWKEGAGIQKLEDDFKKYLGVKYAVSFNSGRSAFYAILKALSLSNGSNVWLQAFTCNAVPNPILWAHLDPVYVDCAEDFNIDIEDLKRKIKPHGVLVLQHTFGLPANMDEVMAIVRQNSLTLIEDCAHALGAQYTSSVGLPTKALAKVGTFGKAAFFSFSRDKVISSVYGGMAITNDDELGKKLQELHKQFGKPGLLWIKQQILHPILLHYIILPLYKFFDLGKLFLIFSQVVHILSKAVSWKEKRGLRPNYFPKALPNALAIMAQNQFGKLSAFYDHRKALSQFYYENLQGTAFGLPAMNENQSFLRFVVTHPKAHEILYEAWHRENILLGDWYTSPIAPDDTNVADMKYQPGSCPTAENLAKKTLNLPTHINISTDEAKRIVYFLKKYF